LVFDVSAEPIGSLYQHLSESGIGHYPAAEWFSGFGWRGVVWHVALIVFGADTQDPPEALPLGADYTFGDCRAQTHTP
jgi:hypothetical protein